MVSDQRRPLAVEPELTDGDLAWLDEVLEPIGVRAVRGRRPEHGPGLLLPHQVDTSWLTFGSAT